MKDYTGRFVSIAENVAEFLDKEIDHPLKDFTLTELISHAQEFRQVMMISLSDLSQLINEMEGHQLTWDSLNQDVVSALPQTHREK